MRKIPTAEDHQDNRGPEGLREMHSSNLKIRMLWGDLNAAFAYL